MSYGSRWLLQILTMIMTLTFYLENVEKTICCQEEPTDHRDKLRLILEIPLFISSENDNKAGIEIVQEGTRFTMRQLI
jgi:hypothetical protein